MKKLILTLTFTLGTLAAFAQGGMVFVNGFNATSDRHPVYGPQTDGHGVLDGAWGSTLPHSIMVIGQSSLGGPTGTTVYEGSLLQLGYDFALFAGPVGVGSNNLSYITNVTFRTSASGGLPAGLIPLTNVSIPGIPGGQFADYQLRAWSTEGGQVLDWTTAVLNFDSGDPSEQIGWTPVITTSGPLASGLITPPNTDFTSFSLIQSVPEPGMLALSGLGAAGLLVCRRRK